MWIFSPAELDEGLRILDAVRTDVDVVQVRPKSPGTSTPTRAATARDWTRAVLEVTGTPEEGGPLVLVNDRVDVAALLAPEGCAGVHLGQGDMPPDLARVELGPEALIGWSTHDAEQVGRSHELPVDYLGFGPVFPTPTKGYEQGLGVDRAWIASTAALVPVFPIGGVDLAGAAELASIGRAAVARAITEARDPARAARSLRGLLQGEPLNPRAEARELGR